MFNATVKEIFNFTPDLIRLVIVPDEPIKSFQPGQYVAIGLPGSAPRAARFGAEEHPQKPEAIIKRAYSIASTPEQGNELEFYIAILPQGALTSRLAALAVGDRIFCANKITGHFTLDGVPADANLILVATGTGLAPYIAMMRTTSTWQGSRTISVLHGVRYPDDLGYREELDLFVSRYPGRLKYFPVVSRGGDAWQGTKGHVQQLFQNGTVETDPARDHVFLCGNPAMIESAEQLLVQRGYVVHSKKTPGSLHVEKYW